MDIEYKIIIKQGNLINEDNADIVVNPSNTVLMLGSGVSMAFHKHCGNELQTEMNQLLSDIHSAGKDLKKGDVVSSTSGKARNFKCVFHAAIMDYRPGTNYKDKNPVLSDIITCLKNIEKNIVDYSELYSRKNITLAIPLMGCGHGDLNKHDVIRLYDDFFNNGVKSSVLKCKVIIYGYTKYDHDLLGTWAWKD